MNGIVDRALGFVAGRSGVTRTVLAVWAVASLVLLLTFGSRAGLSFKDGDDAMRLAQVQDLLAGQPWFDAVQHRVAPPGGVSMHWSRLVDVGIAGLILAARPFTDTAMAERVAMALWPLLLLLPAMLATGAIARRIAGPAAILPAAVLFCIGGAATAQFYPGRIDHHNAQLLGTLVLLLGVVRLDDGRGYGLLAGLAAAFMLAIGVETMPYLMLICAYVGLRLATVGARLSPAAAAFGAALGAGTLVLAGLTMAPAHWLESACDALSFPLILGAALGGFGLAALAGPIGRRRTGTRYAALAGLGAVVCAGAFGTGPQCIAGPFAGLDPRLWTVWLDHVGELRSLGDILRQDFWGTLSGYAIVLVAVPAWCLAVTALPERHPKLGLLGALAVLAVALGFVHIRAYTYFLAFPVPIVAAGIAVLARAMSRRGASPASGVLTGLMLALAVPLGLEAPAVLAASASRTDPESAPGFTCADRAAYAPLAALPRTLVLTPIDEAPFVLIASQQAVVAAAYHRGAEGILATYTIFTAPAAEARRQAAARGIGAVALCKGEPSAEWLAATAPDGLAADLLASRPPPWLEPVPAAAAGPLLVYRVRPASP